MLPIFTYETRNAGHVDSFMESGKRAGAHVTLLSSPPDKGNKGYSIFLQNYIHKSLNPPAFEIACFARYFAIADRLKRSSVDMFFLSDTDILIQPKFSEIESFVGDVDTLLSAATTATRDPYTYLEMSPHFSFWRKDSLASFLDYIQQTYSTASGKALLESVFERNRRLDPRSGISDMTLLAMWQKECGLKVENGTTIRDNKTIDHNVGMSSHQSADQFQMRWGIKRLFRDGADLLFRTHSGQLVYPYAIHFQGKYKMIMADTLAGKSFLPVVTAQLISALRTGRSKLARRRQVGNSLSTGQ